MTKKGTVGRTLYVRVTVDGKRKYVDVGMLFKSGRVFISKGMPNPGWWDE